MSFEDLAVKHPAAFQPIIQGMRELNGRIEHAHQQMTEGIIKAMEIAQEGNVHPQDVETQLTLQMRRQVPGTANFLAGAFDAARKLRPELFETASKIRYNPTPGEPA